MMTYYKPGSNSGLRDTVLSNKNFVFVYFFVVLFDDHIQAVC